MKLNAFSWMFGLIGVLGLLGFTTDQPWALLNFAFFANFQYYWWYKMLGPVDSMFHVWDERFVADRTRAASSAFMWGFMGIFLASVSPASCSPIQLYCIAQNFSSSLLDSLFR